MIILQGQRQSIAWRNAKGSLFVRTQTDVHFAPGRSESNDAVKGNQTTLSKAGQSVRLLIGEPILFATLRLHVPTYVLFMAYRELKSQIIPPNI